MISQAVIEQAATFRQAFQGAQPFKHVCIDGFFTGPAAEGSLRDFPPFEQRFAIGDNGEYGGKAVVSNIVEISPFYARLYGYFMERSKPTVWSAKQIEDLRDIYFAIANLHDAMAHLANDE